MVVGLKKMIIRVVVPGEIPKVTVLATVLTHLVGYIQALQIVQIDK